MSLPVRFVPGRVVVDFTPDVTVGYPFAGVDIGRVPGIAVVPIGSSAVVMSERGDPTDVLEPPGGHVITCQIRGWKDNAIRYLRRSRWRPGLATRHAVYSVPGDREPGESMLDDAIRFLYVPDDDSNPAVVAWRGVPTWTPEAEAEFRRSKELIFPLTLHCLRDDEGRILEIGPIHDLFTR